MYSQEPDVEPFSELREKIISVCKQRSSNGIRGLTVMFKAMDRNGDRNLDPTEFKYAMRDYGIRISDLEVNAIVKYFDKDKNGKISFDEFMRAIRGELNERRLKLIHMAFAVLDRSGDGIVTLKDLLMSYDATQHPDFISGTRTDKEIMTEFM